jgi:hypothetical protein
VEGVDGKENGCDGLKLNPPNDWMAGGLEFVGFTEEVGEVGLPKSKGLGSLV